jgi:glycosyltransferase involved in cell wall biosynthesis
MNKLNVNCPIGKTGYGITSLNIVKELDKINNLQVSLFPIGNSMELNADNEKEAISRLVKNSENFDSKSPCLKIWHQFDLANRIGSGKYFSFPFFEVDKLIPKEKTHLNSCDGIFVASQWAKEVLLRNDINKPIFVSPLAVDLSIFSMPPKIRIANENYTFFHIGKWEYRKSHDFLIKCFDQAFDVNDKVELWLLPHNPFLSKQEENNWINLVSNSKLKSKIKIFDRLPTQYHLAEFIFQADCGLFLSRAEGWNNEILESMALNKPIIATFYSAHTEYCNEDNAYLVHVDEDEIANDGKWFHGIGSWAKLGHNELDQTINYMRYVYNNNITHNKKGLETAQKYTWTNTVSIIENTIFNNKGKNYANARKKKRRK